MLLYFLALATAGMLYDSRDRLSRPTFLKAFNINTSTEKRARTQALPWPPWCVLAGRIYYSKQLVARWFEQQSGVRSAEVDQKTDDELAAAGGDAS